MINLSGVPLTLGEAKAMPSLDLEMAFAIAHSDLQTRAALSNHEVDVARMTAELRSVHHG